MTIELRGFSFFPWFMVFLNEMTKVNIQVYIFEYHDALRLLSSRFFSTNFFFIHYLGLLNNNLIIQSDKVIFFLSCAFGYSKRVFICPANGQTLQMRAMRAAPPQCQTSLLMCPLKKLKQTVQLFNHFKVDF